MNQGAPFLQFDSANFPLGERFALFASMSTGYDVAPAEGTTIDSFSAGTDAWLLGELVVTRGHLSAVRLTRSAEQIADDGLDSYSFTLMTRGRWQGEFGTQGLDVGPGQICIVDFARPWTTRCTDTEFVVVVVSRTAIATLARRTPHLHGQLLEGVAGRLLAEHLIALVRHLPDITAAEVPVIERATLSLMGACIEGLGDMPPDSVPAPNRLRERVRSYVEENLSATDLSPARIAQALAVTRPTLYRAFAGSEGIARYIQRRRIEALHILLSRSGETRTLPELALAFGFSSYTQFSRVFRKHFGYTPRDARSGALSNRRGGGATQFQSWLLQLNR